ncbi:WD40 repeat-like protein [Crepidotus variabilis]|uniref:Pre-rRNA-processing protein IPI3 n=1 Tax=Crepidotus variabilis TaxID=179855 RepID=A0A9P6EMN2_9AGAR|nr:WD40 repeat-like protein [Crepidotus variabilis]
MHLQETVLCATSPTSSAAGPGLIAIHDIQTGATLASFKQTSAGSHSVALLESRNSQGGFIIASQPDKSILNVYNFQKDQISLKIVLPEKLTCIALDRRGDLCAGGTAAGRIFIWETASGIMYKSWDAHYRQVNVLRFTNDGAALLSGSDDSGVNVWSVSRLLDDETQQEHMVPYCSLADHTLPVTDILCGIGLFPECRILTSSVDHSLWDLSSRSVLTTFQFPQAISCLAWDVTERLFFAASSDGSIHQMNLFRERESKIGLVTEAVGGGGVSDVIRVESEVARETRKKRLIVVGQQVKCMAISLSSSSLVVGTVEGLVQIYDIPSHQLIRTISTHKGVPISHVQTMIKPPDLIGHISLEIQIGSDTKDVIPVKPIVPFQRTRDVKSREAHEIAVMLPYYKKISKRDTLDYGLDEMLRDHSFFIQPLEDTLNGSGHVDPLSLKLRVSELESEVERLKEQLGKAKGVNDAMWDTVVQKLVGQAEDVDLTGKGVVVNDVEEEQRKRKRGRS